MGSHKKFSDDRVEFLNTVREEFKRLGIQDHPTKTVYDQLHGHPSSWTIMSSLNVTWRELLGELGYETKPNRGNWRALSDEEFSEVVMKFMADHEVVNYPGFQKKASDDQVPGEAMIKSRFGTNAVTMLLQRSFDKYGTPKSLNRRMWSTYSDDELLDHVQDEIETHGLTTLGAYRSRYDRLKAPSYSVLLYRFGTPRKLYTAYRTKFGKKMFETTYAPRRKRERDKADQ